MSKLVAASVAGRRKYAVLAMLLAVSLVWWTSREAQAGTFVNPFWANTSASQESAIAMVASRAMSPEGVDMRTGELFWKHFLFSTPGVVEDLRFR